MASTDPSAAQLTLSGRALALQRRQAMSLAGKAALAPAAQRLHRVATRAAPESCGCGGCTSGGCTCAGRDKAPASNLFGAMLRPAAVIAEGSVRAAARARRAALASSGKSALQQARHQTPPERAFQPATPVIESLTPAIAPQRPAGAPPAGAPGRLAAMQRRQARALQGAPSSAARPSGRVRPTDAKAAVPAKVGEEHTLSGRPVSGTMVNGTRRITGTEPGECRLVTGTEYLGIEPLKALCGTTPPPGAAKVGVMHSLRDQKITGTELGRSPRVTGDEPGSCRAVTGTDYLAREQFDTVCATTPPAPPARKVSVMSTPHGQKISGAPMERSIKVTGDEHGAARVLTGSAYTGVSAPTAAQGITAPVPPKVAEHGTRAGTGVTGTAFDPGPRVTGDRRGLCLPVTGADYVGPKQLQSVCAPVPDVAPVPKTGQDTTWRGQAVTGTQVDRSSRVTGAEPGACAPVSGTPYIGRRQYDGFCEAPQRELQRAQQPSGTTIAAAAITGDRPGAGGSAVTGDERGACGPISGTPYVGTDNGPSACPPVIFRYLPRVLAAQPELTLPAPTDFSIRSPARERDEHGPITGSAFTSSRITGPINKAGGLITGTPEFRHGEAVLPASAPAGGETPPAATRLTGEGSQSGIRISGDAWQGKGRITGTEGTSSLARNPSQRGESRGIGMNAMRFRDQVERVEPPPSPVTGSAGTATRGAAVTVSGGARA